MYEEAVIGAHFWKRINDEITDELRDFNRVMMLLHNGAEFTEMVHFLNLLPSFAKKILYISLTKSYGGVKKYFTNINAQIHFIDCVTLAYSTPSPETDCDFIEAPGDLKSMLEALNTYATKASPDFIVIDSLSQFIDFSAEMVDLVSLQDFTRKIRDLTYSYSCKCIMLYDDYKKKDLYRMTGTNIDSILRLELLRTELDWL